jgi:hypothetical protein
MWEINIVSKHVCDLTGVVIGVVVSTDNGGTQYLTENEYNKLKTKQKNGYKK